MLLLDDANGRYILFRDGLTEECMPGEEILDPPVVLHSYAANEIADGTQLLEKIGSTTVKSTYLNDTQGNASLAQFSIVGSTSDPVNQENRWDEYGRLAETGVYSGEIGDTRENAAVVTGYGYTGVPGAKTSSQVASVSISGGEGAGAFCSSYEYWYDAVGNISDIYKDNALSAHYEYDEAGQLIRADDAQQNQSFTYNYDAGGNLLTKKEYSFTTGTLGTATDTIQYTYGDSSWADKLTSFDGNAVSYDASGNPTAYDGWTYTWEGSGRLTGMNKTGIGSIAFTYNQDGIRTGKTFGSVTTEYTVVDSKITHMQTGSDDLYFFYDENDSLVSLNVDGDDYFYVKNLQGDIIALTDIDGNIVVEYLYDAWGRLLSTTGSMASTLGVDNPFRYRGYFYDIETGLYYLQSRYYMPEWGRFISADGIAQVNGLNLYRYCYNNPIIFVDSNGKMAVSALQMLFNVYTKGLISSSVTAYCTLALNGRGIYNAFHEMAQIYLGKAISRLGYIVDLEHAVFINGKKIGEADVVANKHFVWEIKPLISDEYADKQLIIYTSGTGLKRGFKVDPIIVDVMSKIKMVILVLPGGAAYYYFYSTKAGRAITNAELYNALKTVMVTACAVAASIIAITIAEDIFTGGVGIMDDGVSLAGAAGSMAPIILVGLRTAGYA